LLARRVGPPVKPFDTDHIRRAHAARTVVDASGCHIWVGRVNRRGYGCLSIGGRGPELAHRLSYEVNVGPIPAGVFVLHTCDTPRCVNPAHLWLGTGRDNMADMLAKGRGRWQKARAQAA
jgi:hypothetical protein